MQTRCPSRAATPAQTVPPHKRQGWRAAALLLVLGAFCADASAAIFGPAGVQAAYYPSTSAQVTENPSTAVFGDFNGDGYPDAAVLDTGTNTLIIYTGNAIGTLTPTHEYGIFNLSFYTTFDGSISTADLNGDGKLDLVIGDSLGASVLLGVGDVSASFVAANPQRPKLPSTMGWGVSKTMLRDINGDGRPDIVMTRNDPGSIIDALGVTHVTVLLNAGGGKFGPPVDYSAGTNTSFPNSFVLAPFDGDNVADIIFYDGYGSTSKLYFMKGNADGTFQSAQEIMNSPQGVTYAEAVDLDGDGKMDYLMSFGSQMAWLKGNGNGTFQAAQIILPDTGGFTGYSPAARPVIGDFNHDGLADIAMGGRIFVQQANHTFKPTEQIGWGDDTIMIAGADLNGDLRTDLLTSGPDPKHLAVFKTTAGAATHMVLTGGNNQSTTFSTAFATPLTLKVLDANNVGVPNQQIAFNGLVGGINSAGAITNPGITYTDAQGNATDTATANNTIGCYPVQASLANSNIGLTYTLCNTGNDVLSVVTGDNQSTLVNTAFATALQVKLTTFGNVPKQGVTLSFKAPASGARATLSSTTAVTDANGLASVSATANGTAGSYDVQVSAPGATPAALHLTNAAAAGSAAQIIVSLAATPQSAPINSAFAPLAVKVVDSASNPVLGATVVYTAGFNPTTGAGAVLSPIAGTAITDASGNAQIGATANGFIGNHTVKVSLQGNAAVPAQTIDLRNYAQLPKAMVLNGGTPQSTPTTTKFAQTLSVKLTDGNGKPTPQVLVYFLAPASGAGATLSASSALTDANGIAQVTATANATAGSYQVGAVVFQTSIEQPIALPFDLTNTALPPPPPPQSAVPAPGLNIWGMLLLIGMLLCASVLSATFHEKKAEG
jgi:hypothetical protein